MGMEDLKNKVTDAAGTVKDKVEEGGSGLSDQARGLTDKVKDRFSGSQADDQADDQADGLTDGQIDCDSSPIHANQ